MSHRSADILIVPPRHDPAGVAAAFVKQCLVCGLDFWFESNDRLPSAVPEGISDVKAILIDHREVDANVRLLDHYRAAGAAVYAMHLDRDPAIPNSTLCWGSPRCLHAITVDAGLTPPSERMYQRLLNRDEGNLIGKLSDRLLHWRPERWYDATCYNWQVLLDLSDVCDDPKFADAAVSQMHGLMQEVANPLDNCDCIAPFRPMLLAAQRRNDSQIVDYVKTHVDQYLRDTPKHHGCLVNFDAYARSIRAEILWQVLPSLMLLSKVTGEARYGEIAWEQVAHFEERLYDRRAGLWQHGLGPAGFTNIFWARFVGFALLAQVLLLEYSDPGEDRWQSLLDKFHSTCEQLTGWQNNRGFFYAVVDQPASGEESSGTAWIAAAIAQGRRHGWLNERYADVAERAWQAVFSRVWDGDFPGHMTATTVSHVPGYYHKLPLSDAGWPHFALLAWCERRRMLAGVVS